MTRRKGRSSRRGKVRLPAPSDRAAENPEIGDLELHKTAKDAQAERDRLAQVVPPDAEREKVPSRSVREMMERRAALQQKKQGKAAGKRKAGAGGAGAAGAGDDADGGEGKSKKQRLAVDERHADESLKAYSRRLQANVRSELQERSQKVTREVSEKRQRYRRHQEERRMEKKRAQREKLEELADAQPDQVRFGEVVNEPPKLLPKPRKLGRKATSEPPERKAGRVNIDSLHPSVREWAQGVKRHAGGDVQHEDEEQRAERMAEAAEAKRAEELNRLKVIAMYRAMKKAKRGVVQPQDGEQVGGYL